jgi:DNA-binding NtrC family response regulator
MYDLLSNSSGVNITINAGQLIEAIDYCVDRTRTALEQQINDAAAETYPSRNKVAEILDVDLSTLHRWAKSNYLKPIEIGGKRRYRMSDVNRILGKGVSS